MSQHLWFIRCSAIIPSNIYVNITVLNGLKATGFRKIPNFDYLCVRLSSRYVTKSLNISYSELQSTFRRHWKFCKYNSKTILRVSSSDNCFTLQECNQTSIHKISKNATNRSLLLGFKERKFNYNQIRHLSNESTVNAPIKTDGLYRFLSESAPVVKTQDILVHFHDMSGLPWWATIIVSTLVLRTAITLPLAIYQYYILAKVENLTSEMSAIVEELKKETAFAMKKFNWAPKEARITYNRSLRKQWNKLVIRDNCHPAKASILVFVQLPMWIFLSFALRNLVYMLPHQDIAAQITHWELSVSHFLWLPNLVAPDASWILPVTLGITNLAIIEIQALSKVKEPGKIQKIVTNFFRVLSIVMIPIAASVPACLNLYWVTSSTFGLIQNVALMSPRVKRMVGIPHTASTQDKPYQLITSQFKKRVARLFVWSKDKS